VESSTKLISSNILESLELGGIGSARINIAHQRIRFHKTEDEDTRWIKMNILDAMDTMYVTMYARTFRSTCCGALGLTLSFPAI
jgi:hypothetical protein